MRSRPEGVFGSGYGYALLPDGLADPSVAALDFYPGRRVDGLSVAVANDSFAARPFPIGPAALGRHEPAEFAFGHPQSGRWSGTPKGRQ